MYKQKRIFNILWYIGEYYNTKKIYRRKKQQRKKALSFIMHSLQQEKTVNERFNTPSHRPHGASPLYPLIKMIRKKNQHTHTLHMCYIWKHPTHPYNSLRLARRCDNVLFLFGFIFFVFSFASQNCVPFYIYIYIYRSQSRRSFKQHIIIATLTPPIYEGPPPSPHASQYHMSNGRGRI